MTEDDLNRYRVTRRPVYWHGKKVYIQWIDRKGVCIAEVPVASRLSWSEVVNADTLNPEFYNPEITFDRFTNPYLNYRSASDVNWIDLTYYNSEYCLGRKRSRVRLAGIVNRLPQRAWWQNRGDDRVWTKCD